MGPWVNEFHLVADIVVVPRPGAKLPETCLACAEKKTMKPAGLCWELFATDKLKDKLADHDSPCVRKCSMIVAAKPVARTDVAAHVERLR